MGGPARLTIGIIRQIDSGRKPEVSLGCHLPAGQATHAPKGNGIFYGMPKKAIGMNGNGFPGDFPAKFREFAPENTAGQAARRFQKSVVARINAGLGVNVQGGNRTAHFRCWPPSPADSFVFIPLSKVLRLKQLTKEWGQGNGFKPENWFRCAGL